jgi:peptidoglycan hydrolase CwlO-like protein
MEESLKKMGIVLEKLVKKVDEIDKRLQRLEEKNLGNSSSKTSTSSFGSSFLGSLTGAMAGMGLYNLLFNNSISAEEFAKEMGVNEDDLNDIDAKLDEITSQLDDMQDKLDEIENNFDEDLSDFSDFDGEI